MKANKFQIFVEYFRTLIQAFLSLNDQSFHTYMQQLSTILPVNDPQLFTIMHT